jgi:hypothetical protein
VLSSKEVIWIIRLLGDDSVGKGEYESSGVGMNAKHRTERIAKKKERKVN